jgi:uncharacterized protein YkwD
MMRFGWIATVLLAGTMVQAEETKPAADAKAAATANPAADAKPAADARPETVAKAAATTAEGMPLWEIEQALVDETNAHRARYSLPPLKIDPTLISSSRSHSWYMARTGAFHHGRFAVHENIAVGQPNHIEALRCWMGSSGHFANIIRFRHGRIGVAAYQRSNGSIYWTQQFAGDDQPAAVQAAAQPVSYQR